MKNRGKNIALIAAGIVLGSTISGPAASAAEMLAAQRSTQKIYVDGRQVQMEAYAIGGNNYVKLRDVGKAVGFNVSRDSSAVLFTFTDTGPSCATSPRGAPPPPRACRGGTRAARPCPRGASPPARRGRR